MSEQVEDLALIGACSGLALSEGRRRRVGTYPAAGRIERFDVSHIVGVEKEVERSDVLPQALRAHGFRNDDQAAVEMTAYHAVGRLIVTLVNHLILLGNTSVGAPANSPHKPVADL